MKYLNVFGKIQTIGIEFEDYFTQHEIFFKKGKLFRKKCKNPKIISITHSFAKNAKNNIYIVRILTLNISAKILWEECVERGIVWVGKREEIYFPL